ncbi:MAG TPA: MBL fold metallo-hydrolase [Candidatus Thalassarchaeaceae archaeon]|nr:MBL fold metallo-hydrolase [Candidatus Thalassarchaeaceae archaeon]
MVSGGVRVAILGIAQDGGVPQAGCNCDRCTTALNDHSLRLHPTSCAVMGEDGGLHLIEASRAIAQQLGIASDCLGLGGVAIPETVCLTHTHLGHIDGLGQFGKEAMGLDSVPLMASSKVLEVVIARSLDSPFELVEVCANSPFMPTEGCGFRYTLIPIPHRDDQSDTHAILISGPNKTLLFLPDQDSWNQTLDLYGSEGVKSWLTDLGVDVALIDGTFWDGNELPGRDLSRIPHPSVSESLSRIGAKEEGDPDIIFIHLNHSNPLIDEQSPETREVESMGWAVARQSSVIDL